MMHRQLFLLTSEIFDSVSVEEIEATWEDMQEAGLAQPPYDWFAIGTPIGVHSKVVDNSGVVIQAPVEFYGMELRYSYRNGRCELISLIGNRFYADIPDLRYNEPKNPSPYTLKQTNPEHVAARIYRLLIVLLATRNIVKKTTTNHLARFGVGKQKAEYTTTLHIGQVNEIELSKPIGHTGVTLRPHLRRGHVRRQHYGPQRQYVKMVFIQPVFVNADPEFIDSRKSYNVSMPSK